MHLRIDLNRLIGGLVVTRSGIIGEHQGGAVLSESPVLEDQLEM